MDLYNFENLKYFPEVGFKIYLYYKLHTCQPFIIYNTLMYSYQRNKNVNVNNSNIIRKSPLFENGDARYFFQIKTCNFIFLKNAS
jgi:hypothetical protein